MRKVVLRIIEFYQRAISPMMAPRCRFYPSCSSYAHEAVTTHGVGRGTWLSVVRLSKCHPLHRGGVDLVPENKHQTDKRGTTPSTSALIGEQQHG